MLIFFIKGTSYFFLLIINLNYTFNNIIKFCHYLYSYNLFVKKFIRKTLHDHIQQNMDIF